MDGKPIRHQDWKFGCESGGISLEPKGKPPAGSWWVGVPRGDQWDAVVAKETKRMNPASSVPPMPQGGVWKSA